MVVEFAQPHRRWLRRLRSNRLETSQPVAGMGPATCCGASRLGRGRPRTSATVVTGRGGCQHRVAGFSRRLLRNLLNHRRAGEPARGGFQHRLSGFRDGCCATSSTTVAATDDRCGAGEAARSADEPVPHPTRPAGATAVRAVREVGPPRRTVDGSGPPAPSERSERPAPGWLGRRGGPTSRTAPHSHERRRQTDPSPTAALAGVGRPRPSSRWRSRRTPRVSAPRGRARRRGGRPRWPGR